MSYYCVGAACDTSIDLCVDLLAGSGGRMGHLTPENRSDVCAKQSAHR